MASLREIRRKIKSVKSTQQITKAMKMVAAARMRKAQNAILSSRPFAVKLEQVVRDLAILEVRADRLAGRVVKIHPFFDVPEAKDKACLIFVTADKGLCGAFNTSILRTVVAWLQKNSEKRVSVFTVGRKGRDFMNRLEDRPEIIDEMIGIFPKVTFAHAELIGKPIVEGFVAGKFGAVSIIYNEFKSALTQRVIETPLLPIPVPDLPEEPVESAAEDPATATANPYGFHFEPSREKLLEALLPRYIKAQIYRALLESQAAELAARMNAMDSATKNAGDLLDFLTLTMNRTRQAIITGEIAELVSGAEVLKS